jgi:exodeoxyribonuclease VII large subunit
MQPWHEHLVGLSRRLRHSTAARLRLSQLRTRELARALHAISPLATLQRGYAILSNPANGEIVRSTAQAQPGISLRARVADGEFDVRVESKP